MKGKNEKVDKKEIKIPIFLLLLLNFIIIISLAIYIIYLRFVPYTVIKYEGYAVSGKQLANNLLDTTFDVDKTIKAIPIKEQEEIYKKLGLYYVGANKKENINLNYPVYVNNSLALYNLSKDVELITNDFQVMEGYPEFTLTSGELYNDVTLERADYYDYILMKNIDNLYINVKEINIKTSLHEYTIPMNSIINFTNKFITYYSLNNDEFVYNKIIDIDDNSDINIKDYKSNYSYKDFLIGLNKRKAENINEQEDENLEEIESEENIVKKEESNEKTEQLPEENTVIERPQEEEKEEENSNSNYSEQKWIKPSVECTNFITNVYSAQTKIKIYDPSKVIHKAITFTFYKDDEIAFRSSTIANGDLKITKLLPNQKYTIIGTYQYKNKEGSLISNTFTKQEIITKNIDNLNPISLEIVKGNVYASKIELKEISIISDIQDEAILGVSKAEVLINNVPYSIDGNSLRKMLKGEKINFKTPEGLESNIKVDFKIVFYDVADNIMKLEGNTGNIVTSKMAPSTKFNIQTQDIIYVLAEINLDNVDQVDISNYRYVLYSDTGEIIKKGELSGKKEKVKFENLDPQKVYSLKTYADFDIEDGNGKQENQQIGSTTFITLPIRSLGSLKLDVICNEKEDITCNKIKFKTAINTYKTDSRLIKILKSLNIKIKDQNGEIIEDIQIIDINKLQSTDGIDTIVDNLKSNSVYYLDITAKVKQGNIEENVSVTYLLNKFNTRKKSAQFFISNLIVTNDLIDMDIFVEDIDRAIDKNIVNISLNDHFQRQFMPTIEPNSIKDITKIPTNQWVRLTYSGLTKDMTYTLSCLSEAYNETNVDENLINNYLIYKEEFITSGLGGILNLNGLERKINDTSENLIDITSENDWYSKCFDAMENNYELDEGYNVSYNIKPKYNYDKTYKIEGNNSTLKMLSNQCYVYDFSKYKGEEVTVSFNAKTSENGVKVYIQEGMEIGKNLNELNKINMDGWTHYSKTLKIPEDGYVGFYLEPYERTKEVIVDDEITYETEVVDYYLYIENLMVNKGKTELPYKLYEYKLYANVTANFLDKEHITFDEQEKNCGYYIRIIASDGQVNEYRYSYDSIEEVSNTYEYIIRETEYEVEYKIELLIKQNNREYVLDTVEFQYNYEDCSEIKSINNEEDFKKIQPYGNYILLNDLNLTNCNTKHEFTFGNPNILFYGSIDFNGKTIKKDSYSKSKNIENTSYVFYKISETAELNNIVLDYYINNEKNRYTVSVDGMDYTIDKKDGIYGLFLYNEGKINNLMFNLKDSTERQRINVGLVGYQNIGVIENFVINFEKKLYGSQYLSGICLYSSGIIQNGYIYGEGIETVGEITLGDYRYIAGAVFQVDGAGILQNIYNLAPIYMNHTDATYSYAANLVYNVGYPPKIDEQTGNIVSTQNSTAIVRNIYSINSLMSIYNNYEHFGLLDSSNKDIDLGPNILFKYTNTRVTDSYYFCDVMYGVSDFNTKSSATALYEPGVQEVMLNANHYRQFIIDAYVNNGYYPHLKLNNCMPNQTPIRIEIEGTEIIDVLSGNIIENNDIYTLDLSEKVLEEVEKYIKDNKVNIHDENIKLAEFRIYNPAGTTISEINLHYLSTSIMSQAYSKKVSKVYVVLHTPTSFLNEYEVASIKSRMANGREKESIYGEKEDLGIRTVKVTFIKYIKSAEEWSKISENDINGISGLIQNYRLIEDIDFNNAEYSPYITGTFEGYLDGEHNGKIHKLKNIQGSGSLIKAFSKGKICNLYVENYSISNAEQFVGFIGKADITENIEISNVHIKNMEVISNYSNNAPYIGGIAGYITSGSNNKADDITIKNCSIQGLTVDFTKPEVTNIYVGGIVGYLYAFGGVEVKTDNCFAQNILFNADVTSIAAVGGIVGYKGHDTNSGVKEGVPNFYIRNCFSTGKINTKMYAGGILGYGRYGNTFVQNCYSIVNFNSKVTSGYAYIGGIVGYSDIASSAITGNLYLGNIYVAGNSVKNVNRIFGNKTDTSGYRNYAYKDQLINGETTSSVLGATKLLSYDEIFQINTYSNLLKWDNNYAYKIIDSNGNQFDLIANQFLPELNDTNGNLLPNQKMNALDNDLKLDSIVSTPSSDKTEVMVTMKFVNPNNLNLTRVKIENDDMQVKQESWTTYKEESTGLTIVKFTATPNRAYDSYKIEYIYYERNGQENEKEISTKIKVELYKSISNAKEWNDFFSGSGRTYTGQNVKIKGTIDFSTVSTIESNVIIGRLEADNLQTIKNVNLSNLGQSSGFIKEIKSTLKNIKFEKCSINTKASYVGLIGILRAQTSNCQFSDINISGVYDYIGIISRCIAGGFNNITLKNVTITGRNYIGSLCGQATSMSASSNITGTYIMVKATGDNVGGLMGYVNGGISNVGIYQYSAEGKKEDDKETECLVKGRNYVGGCAGQFNHSNNRMYNIMVTNSKIIGTTYVGGNMGYTAGNVDTIKSINNVINGSSSGIGGNIGFKNWWYSSNCISENNSITGNTNVGGNIGQIVSNSGTLIATNNQISGNNNIGGSIGYVSYYNSVNNKIIVSGVNYIVTGANYVGGIVGKTLGRLQNVKVIDCKVTGRGNYVGGIAGSSEYSTTSISSNNNNNYTIAGANIKNVIINGSQSYVGGISGYQLGTVYGAVVEDSIINSKGNNVGGISGYYTGYNGKSANSLSSSNFFLWHSFCVNSSIKGENNTGGIVGTFKYGNIQYCYVANTSIEANVKGAGGIVGFFDNSQLSNLQYKASIKYNYIVNLNESSKIYAENSVGGLVGNIRKQLNFDETRENYNNIECNLIVADLYSMREYVSMGIGAINNEIPGITQYAYMNNIYVYNCSKINYRQVGFIQEENIAYKLISANDMKEKAFYTRNNKITDEEGTVIGNEGLNFGTGRYEYTNGYFPVLKNSYSAVLYWDANNLNIKQTKIAIPNRTEEFNNIATYSIRDVTSNIATMSLLNMNMENELPEVYIYPIDVDKINIEFSDLQKFSKIRIDDGQKTLINDYLNKQIYTLQYDFNNPLTITVYNSDMNYTKIIKKEEINNIVMIGEDEEFIYLDDYKLCSNKRNIDGEFVNIYNGKALGKNGLIYDVKSLNVLTEEPVNIEVMEDILPITENKYKDSNIKTFYHYSIVEDNNGTSKKINQQMFVKKDNIFLVDGKFKGKGNSIIIDSYNDIQFESILGDDGKIYDLLTPINYPENFKNSEIIAITNNLDYEGENVLVYYKNGNVIAFNYITGKEVYNNNNNNNNNIDLFTYTKNAIKSKKLLYDISNADYKASKNLAQKLDEVSINDALIKIDEKSSKDGISDNKVNNNSNLENKTEAKYITTYDVNTQNYVVYNTNELLDTKLDNVISETEKISLNSNLSSYYSGFKTKTEEFDKTGIIVIFVIIGNICIILFFLNRKIRK